MVVSSQIVNGTFECFPFDSYVLWKILMLSHLLRSIFRNWHGSNYRGSSIAYFRPDDSKRHPCAPCMTNTFYDSCRRLRPTLVKAQRAFCAAPLKPILLGNRIKFWGLLEVSNPSSFFQEGDLKSILFYDSIIRDDFYSTKLQILDPSLFSLRS